MGKKKLKLTTLTSEQIKLTKILADENILDEKNIQQLQNSY